MKIKVGINGMGRIGRMIVRSIIQLFLNMTPFMESLMLN
jgi:glyceraldehyde-3-phosphate dehydrogenase/erythrose-4-phosphate dehydrogenase